MAVVRWHPTMPWRPFQQPWRPFEGIESLRHEMDRLFEPFAGSTQQSGIRESEWIPRVDLLEHENAFVLVADLPGMKEDDFTIAVQDNVLTLEGKRTCAYTEHGHGRYHSSERASGTFCRRFLLSAAVKAAQITATSKHGVLAVHLPKAAEAQPKRRVVQASSSWSLGGAHPGGKCVRCAWVRERRCLGNCSSLDQVCSGKHTGGTLLE